MDTEAGYSISIVPWLPHFFFFLHLQSAMGSGSSFPTVSSLFLVDSDQDRRASSTPTLRVLVVWRVCEWGMESTWGVMDPYRNPSYFSCGKSCHCLRMNRTPLNPRCSFPELLYGKKLMWSLRLMRGKKSKNVLTCFCSSSRIHHFWVSNKYAQRHSKTLYLALPVWVLSLTGIFAMDSSEWPGIYFCLGSPDFKGSKWLFWTGETKKFSASYEEIIRHKFFCWEGVKYWPIKQIDWMFREWNWEQVGGEMPLSFGILKEKPFTNSCNL